MKTFQRLGFVVALLVPMNNAGPAPHPVTPAAPATVTPTRSAQIQVMMAAEEPAGQGDVDEADGIVDLYGNEVTEAVAQYTIDPAGGLYEVHSPQTELPRLGSPKS